MKMGNVKWDFELYRYFDKCNKLVLCSYETKEVKRVLWINGHDSKRWGRWGVHKYLTGFALVAEGEIVLHDYDSFLLTLASAKDKSMAMLYRLCYPVDLLE